MEHGTWTDRHSGAVAEAAPAVSLPGGEELDRLWMRVQADMGGPPRRSRRSVRLVIGAAATAAALAVGGVAAAQVFSSHTGRYPADAEGLRLGGPGELLDPAASDYGEVVTALTGDIPFPSRRARDVARDSLIADGRRDARGTSTVSTGAMRGWTAQAAVCAWANQWAAATVSGNGAMRAAAAGKLVEAPTWNAFTDVDPIQRIGYRKTTATDRSGRTRTNTVSDSTEFGYLPLVRDAAQGREVDAMARVLSRWVYCQAELMIDLPQALPQKTKR